MLLLLFGGSGAKGPQDCAWGGAWGRPASAGADNQSAWGDSWGTIGALPSVSETPAAAASGGGAPGIDLLYDRRFGIHSRKETILREERDEEAIVMALGALVAFLEDQ